MYKEDILGQELIGTLPKASQYLRKTFESILESFGFGLVSYLILQRLWQCDKQPMKELEDQMELSTSQLLIAIKELEAGSFTTREPNPADGRSRLVCLTERGARVQESAWRLNNQILDLLRKDKRLSTMDLHDLNRFCKLVVQVLETF
ncbi:MAG: MarR family transcriptional regulator [Sphaerochaeta sp.]